MLVVSVSVAKVWGGVVRVRKSQNAPAMTTTTASAAAVRSAQARLPQKARNRSAQVGSGVGARRCALADEFET